MRLARIGFDKSGLYEWGESLTREVSSGSNV